MIIEDVGSGESKNANVHPLKPSVSRFVMRGAVGEVMRRAIDLDGQPR
jgi:hypothetical protein